MISVNTAAMLTCLYQFQYNLLQQMVCELTRSPFAGVHTHSANKSVSLALVLPNGLLYEEAVTYRLIGTFYVTALQIAE